MVDRHNWQHIVRLGFWSVQLYADVTLQLFFIVTSITGWIHWLKGQGGDILPVRRTQASHFSFCCSVLSSWQAVTAFTPHLYQCLGTLAGFVDFDLQRSGTIHVDGKTYRKLVRLVSGEYLAVPLYMTRGLNLTAGLYFLFWINAWYGLYQWRKELQTS